MTRRLFACLLIGPLLAGVLSCRRQAVEETESNADVPRVIRHAWRTTENGQWKAEVWLGATTIVADPVRVSVRLAPQGEGEAELPEASVTLTMSRNDAPATTRRVNVSPVFRACSDMPKRREFTGETETAFPPKGLAWEAVMKDPFECDVQAGHDKTFKPGKYSLVVQLSLRDGSQLNFEPIRIECRRY
jgi:hypothetical protein